MPPTLSRATMPPTDARQNSRLAISTHPLPCKTTGPAVCRRYSHGGMA